MSKEKYIEEMELVLGYMKRGIENTPFARKALEFKFSSDDNNEYLTVLKNGEEYYKSVANRDKDDLSIDHQCHLMMNFIQQHVFKACEID